eukprot:snap_masked-scaffold_52-processed-gene-0.29-mRNA-1 protein AED:1.00 eAED:1.00 QI:0/0/0/0/1/1/3/0/911
MKQNENQDTINFRRNVRQETKASEKKFHQRRKTRLRTNLNGNFKLPLRTQSPVTLGSHLAMSKRLFDADAFFEDVRKKCKKVSFSSKNSVNQCYLGVLPRIHRPQSAKSTKSAPRRPESARIQKEERPVSARTGHLFCDSIQKQKFHPKRPSTARTVRSSATFQSAQSSRTGRTVRTYISKEAISSIKSGTTTNTEELAFCDMVLDTLETGHDAVTFFAENGSTTPLKYIYLVPDQENQLDVKSFHFRPYDLLVTRDLPRCGIYYIVSGNGILKLRDGDVLEQLGLAVWLQQATMFNNIAQIKFFRQFRLTRLFKRWRKSVRKLSFLKKNQKLERNAVVAVLNMSNQDFMENFQVCMFNLYRNGASFVFPKLKHGSVIFGCAWDIGLLFEQLNTYIEEEIELFNRQSYDVVDSLRKMYEKCKNEKTRVQIRQIDLQERSLYKQRQEAKRIISQTKLCSLKLRKLSALSQIFLYKRTEYYMALVSEVLSSLVDIFIEKKLMIKIDIKVQSTARTLQISSSITEDKIITMMKTFFTEIKDILSSKMRELEENKTMKLIRSSGYKIRGNKPKRNTTGFHEIDVQNFCVLATSLRLDKFFEKQFIKISMFIEKECDLVRNYMKGLEKLEHFHVVDAIHFEKMEVTNRENNIEEIKTLATLYEKLRDAKSTLAFPQEGLLYLNCSEVNNLYKKILRNGKKVLERVLHQNAEGKKTRIKRFWEEIQNLLGNLTVRVEKIRAMSIHDVVSRLYQMDIKKNTAERILKIRQRVLDEVTVLDCLRQISIKVYKLGRENPVRLIVEDVHRMFKELSFSYTDLTSRVEKDEASLRFDFQKVLVYLFQEMQAFEEQMNFYSSRTENRSEIVGQLLDWSSFLDDLVECEEKLKQLDVDGFEKLNEWQKYKSVIDACLNSLGFSN